MSECTTHPWHAQVLIREPWARYCRRCGEYERLPAHQAQWAAWSYGLTVVDTREEAEALGGVFYLG